MNAITGAEALPGSAVAAQAGRGESWSRIRRHHRLPLAAVVLLTCGHFAWLLAHYAPAIMSPDANGYVTQARLIAESGRTYFATTSPVQFVGMHWLETAPGEFHSRYPAGLPLLFALAWKLGGLTAALLVNPLLASGTVLLVFFLARRLTGGWAALLAAAVVATVPATNQHALDADAHIGAAFFLVAGVLAVLRFGDTLKPAHGLLAGMLLGMVPAIRYPEAIVGLALGGWLVWRARPVWRVWPAVVGAALPLLPLLVHNASAYGAFWRTGYALTNEQTGFGVSYFLAHAVPYLQSLGGQGLGLFFAFGVAGLAALVVDSRSRAEGALFAGMMVPLVLLYMAYYFGGPGGAGGQGAANGNLRFLIPTFPFFAVTGAWLAGRLAGNLGRAGLAAVVAVASLQLLIAVTGSVQALGQAKTSLRAAARTRAVAQKEIPAGSVIIVERTLAESLDAVGRWRLVEENTVGGTGPRGGPGGMMRPMGGPGFGEAAGENAPSPQQIGKNHSQQERYAGLSPTARRARVWTDIAAWAGDRPVYWLARSLDAVEAALPAGANYEGVAEVDTPAMLGMGAPGGGMPPGMGGPGGRGLRGPGGMNFAPGFGGPGFPARGNFGEVPGGVGGRGGGGPNAGSAKLRVVKIILPQR